MNSLVKLYIAELFRRLAMAYKSFKSVSNDPYLEQLSAIRQDVLSKFSSLYQTLKMREIEIFAEIDRLEAEYKGYYSESESKLKEFYKMKKYADEAIKDNETQSRFLAYIDTNLCRIKNTQKDLTSWTLLSVKWGPSGHDDIVNLINQITITLTQDERSTDTNTTMDNLYSKRCPILRGGKIGSIKKFGDIVHPNHLAIDQNTGNIYVADSKKNSVHVFTKEAKYLYVVPQDFRVPRAICCRNNLLYVVENDFNAKFVCFKVLNFDGFLQNQAVLKFGKDLGEFKIVPSFDISEKDEWYVCDLKANRIQIFSNKLEFLCVFGNDRLHAPTSVRVHMSEIFVLESPTYDIAPLSMKGGCSIKVFNEYASLLYVIPLKDVKEAWYFDVDASRRLVVSDIFANCIRVLNKSGDILHKIGGKGNKEVKLNQPKGVIYTTDGDIVCVCMNESGCLQLF
ncbi:Outer membrane phospholipase A [Oopsacas minuta]|uniref:Outer membrane phospholipase A n=1 Tax=Oopsacas minuta TaxID=111878 RepID=A0AAV7K5S4_9METZ|nr:Outer membrane phospholipase A [Oopsacas minuta]